MLHLRRRITAADLKTPRPAQRGREGSGPSPGGGRERGPSLACLTLSFEDRRRSRLRARLDDGREVGLFLARGTLLQEGDWLVDDDGTVEVQVKARAETLSVAHTPEVRLLARAAYHLGNRHVPLQVGGDWLAYGHDHVLDDLVRALGLSVVVEQRPFEPEAGGYVHGPAESHPTAHPHEPGAHHEH